MQDRENDHVHYDHDHAHVHVHARDRERDRGIRDRENLLLDEVGYGRRHLLEGLR